MLDWIFRVIIYLTAFLKKGFFREKT